MWAAKVAYYRSFQAVFNVGAHLVPWRKAIRVSGPGSVRRLPALLRLRGVAKPLVVSGPVLAKSGTIAPLLGLLEKQAIPYVLFTDVEADPSTATAEKIRDTYLQQHCSGFVAVGGGSVLDAAKAAAALVARPGKTAAQLGGLLRVRRAIPPFIAVPTTAGTGSETTIAAVVTNGATHHKYAIMDPCLVPRYAILDPQLTLGLPPGGTAASGMDALTHAVEAYLCQSYNTAESLADALRAVTLVFDNLEEAYTNGQNLAARQAMLQASYLAGAAFTRAGVGNVHAIAHTIGGLYGTPHGVAVAAVLPTVLQDYGPAVHQKLARLAGAARLPTAGSTAQAAQAFIDAIRAMNRRMGIPAGFAFIKEEDIPQMVQWASAEANPLYPVPVLYPPQRFAAVIRQVRSAGLAAGG